MIVVDSSVWIDRFRGIETEATRKLMAIEDLGEVIVGDIVFLEVLQGARDDRHAARLERSLRHFAIEPMLNGDLAVAVARNYRHLRGLGVTVRKTPDMIIATFCIERGHLLLQQDRDFAPMVAGLGLRLI